MSTVDEIIDIAEVEHTAKERYYQVITDSNVRAARYEKYHNYFAPVDGDQWPEERLENLGKIHVTANMVRRFVDTEARLLSMEPRVNIPIDEGWDDATGLRAEATEKLFKKYRDASSMDEWSFTLNETKSLYGIGILHPYWDDIRNMPTVEVVEQPQDLLIGWGDSNFNDIDWTIYYYRISKLQAKIKYGSILTDADLNTPMDHPGPSPIAGGARDHDLPEPYDNNRQIHRNQTAYEADQIPVWDYWYLEEDGSVYNCVLVNGHIVTGPVPHPEMPTIPYIPIESDHEPGSPDGHGTAELLIDLQMSLNRLLSLYVQAVWDLTEPAYQLVGEMAPTVIPPGLVPKAGQIIPPGPGVRIETIGGENLNNFPLDSSIQRIWDIAYRITGMNAILLGEIPNAQTSGRALSVQLEGAANAIDPKRRRYYRGLINLMNFWHAMAMKKNPKVDGQPVKDVIDGMNRWQIIPPEITPKDVIEHTTNVINKLGAKLQSLETSMDELGIENPLQEMDRIRKERGDIHLFPQDAQGTAAVWALIQQISQQMGMSPNQAAANQNPAQAAAQQAQPTGTQDQNQPGTQPMTQAGSAPPPGAPTPIGATYQPLERFTPGGQAQAMSQIQLPQRKF